MEGGGQPGVLMAVNQNEAAEEEEVHLSFNDQTHLHTQFHSRTLAHSRH